MKTPKICLNASSMSSETLPLSTRQLGSSGVLPGRVEHGGSFAFPRRIAAQIWSMTDIMMEATRDSLCLHKPL